MKFTDEQIEEAKLHTRYTTGKPHHEHPTASESRSNGCRRSGAP